ncbi:MAG: AraC family transcriptional regulator [Gammaproteobacteria bacterium]|nr:AraC family transcriptional regulator [Gammaproteobacteria bacterium]
MTEMQLNRKALIDIDKYEQLYRYAENQLGDTHLGFNYGQHIDANRWGILGQIAYSSATLEQALQNQRRYQSMVGDLGDPNFSIDNDTLILTWFPARAYSHHIAEELLTSWVAFARRTTATNISPKRVWFSHPNKDNPEVYQSYFNCPVHFRQKKTSGQTSIGLSISANVLQLPCSTANPELNRTLKTYANSIISQYSIDNPVSVAKDFIASQLPNETPTLSQLASSLAVSERTLQRRLTEFDSTFKLIVDEVKNDIAINYLINTQKSFQDISEILKFSEQSAFSRAVKRWTGLSPAQYRKRNQILIF